MPTLAAEWHLGEVFLVFLEFAMFFIWIWLLIMIFGDLFRSHDLSGWVKAMWVIGIIIFPFLGILLYLIVRGGSMHERAVKQAKQTDAAFKSYVAADGVGGQHGRAAPEAGRPEGERRDRRCRVRAAEGQGPRLIVPASRRA